MSVPRPRSLLILSQTYVPDPAASGQMLASAAGELARRGRRVRVLTSGRGYYDAGARYAARETIDGVDVQRLPLSSFGTRFFALRLVAAMLFLVQVIVRGALVRRVDCILVSTSPPMCFVAALVIGLVRRVPIKFWVMDLSPDLLIAVGRTTPGSLTARTLEMLNRRMVRRAADVVALDRFMAERINAKLDASDKLTVTPPWTVGELMDPVAHDENPFRAEHGLDGRLVFMYSGNFGLALPLDTFVQAAIRLDGDPRVRFVFIGGGAKKADITSAIERHGLRNMIALPYQPLDRLRYSLSAADVHLVSLGDRMVGVTHPSKVYGILAIQRPILYLGPHPSFVSEMIETHRIGWRIAHGDIDGAERMIREILEMPRAEIEAMGRRARALTEGPLGRDVLRGRFCDVVERGVQRDARPAKNAG